MKPDRRFTQLDKRFWANIRSISEKLGYTARRTKKIKVYDLEEIRRGMHSLGLQSSHISHPDGKPTELGAKLHEYFRYRADVINTFVRPHLMDARRARSTFTELYAQLQPTCPIPKNKQKGEKAGPAYLTAIVNMLIEANSNGLPCDYDPKRLTTFTDKGMPVRTLARRVDGCFPGAVNPIAIWEIKEYYYTTTFGSRVADGIYETLLDGLELEDLRDHEGVSVQHLLIIDAYETWWNLGRSYLCRVIDMLHMGYVDEVLFGYEVVERLPQIVRGWVAALEADR